jgi:outer membrane protein
VIARWRFAAAVGTCTLCLLWAATPVRAWQEADTLRLDLADALRFAAGGNPAYRRAENAVGLNAAESRATWLGELVPQVSVSLFNTAYTGNLQRRATDNFGNPIENPAADWVYFSSTSQALSVGWEIQGRSIFDAYRGQQLLNRERTLSRDVAWNDLLVDVRRRYMDALEQRELERAEAELIGARELDREVAERLYSLAMRTRVDVLNAELALEQQALALQRQRAAHERALLALRSALGMDAPQALDLAEESVPAFDPSALDADVLVRRALDGNPVLRRSEVGVRRAEVAASEERNAWWPRLSMGFDVFRRAQQPDRGALFDVSFDEDLDSRFFLQLSIPVFNDFFQKRRASEQASVERDNRREENREARLRVEEAVRGAHLELGSQWASLRLAERSHEIAGEALRLAREEYRLGTRTFEDLRASFDREAETRRQVIQARYAFARALLDLEAAVGAPVGPDLAGATFGDPVAGPAPRQGG